MKLPAEVIETDHNLEKIADRAGHQLAAHRHYWTLDESNPQRVTVAEYARQVGRAHATIRVMVLGFDSHSRNEGSPSDLQHEISKARMSSESAAAAEAVAKARGVSLGSVRDVRTRAHQEARRVREIARQLAEERGTSVEQEAPKVAETIVRQERAEQAAEADKRERHDIRFIELEGYLVKAKRELLKALKIAPNVDWDDESKELLTETVGNVKALLTLIDTALSGMSGVDWDAEFAKVAGNENL